MNPDQTTNTKTDTAGCVPLAPAILSLVIRLLGSLDIAVIVDIAVLWILLLFLYADFSELLRSPVPGAWHVLCLFRRRRV